MPEFELNERTPVPISAWAGVPAGVGDAAARRVIPAHTRKRARSPGTGTPPR